MAALVAEFEVQRRSLMEVTVAHVERLACSSIPEIARIQRILSTMQLHGVFQEGPHLLDDCVGMCTALLEDGSSLALYHRARVLPHSLSVCIKDIYCPVWQSLLDKWMGSLSKEGSRCEGDVAHPLKAFLTRLTVLWTHGIVAQILRSITACDVGPRKAISPTCVRRILVAEYQPDSAGNPAQCTAEVELAESDNLQWWALCLPTDLADGVSNGAATVLQHAARLWVEEDLRDIVSADHSLGKVMESV